MKNDNSLSAAFNAAALMYANKTAIESNGVAYTFLDVKNTSDKFACNLIERGVIKGDRVALYSVNCYEFAVAYIGIVKAGAVVVPINTLQKPDEIQYVLKNASVKGVVYHLNLDKQIQQIRKKITEPLFFIPMSNSEKTSLLWDRCFNNSGDLVMPDITPATDLAAILYTSGTTGEPKGAMLTHQNLVTNTNSVFKAMKWTAGKDTIVLVLPMFHAFAATVGMLTPLTNGCCFVTVEKFEINKLLLSIEQTQSTVFLGVPSMYNILLGIKPEQASMLQSITQCISGGASMPVDVLKQFEEKFSVPIYEGDGPTECSPVTCVNPIGGVRKIGTVGLPVPNVQMKIINEIGEELPNGEIGEIAVRGRSVMKGYWRRPKETEAAFDKGWFLTGDLGTEDTDGYFSILDRKKDMVIVNGMNVYPRIIEEVLYKHPAIHEVAVIGAIDKRHGEIPVAYVVLIEETAATELDIKKWCRQFLGNYEVPKKIIFMSNLPKNAAGKIVKRVLNKSGEIERGVT